MKKLCLFSGLIAVLFFAACSKNNNPTGGGGTIIPPAVAVRPLITLPPGWTYSASYSSAFPSGIQAYTFDTIFAGRSTRAYCLAYDSKNTDFEFKPVVAAVGKTPSNFFSQEPGITYACINGGFFGGNQSYSLVKFNNVVLSANIKVVNRTYNGSSTAYYPTRAAFGISATGEPKVSWVYHLGAGNENIYSYPSPSPNEEGNLPLPAPSESFPAGGIPWSTVSAIGGAPVLLQHGNVIVSDKVELINIDNTTSRARSAIGYNAGNIVMLVSIEGAETGNPAQIYMGMNLEELAGMMKALGCTNAINLDGGGSTSMVIGNKLTVRPSDKGVERPVISAILIKKK